MSRRGLRWPFPRRESVPPEVRAAVHLADGERVLTACRSADGAYLVATDRALHLVVLPDSQRLRWDLVDRAGWQPPVLTLEARATDDAPLGTIAWEADPASDLPGVVRDRVTASVLATSRIAVPGGGVRVVARRNTDSGAVEWRVIPTSGVDPDDPSIRAAIDGEVAAQRAELGE